MKRRKKKNDKNLNQSKNKQSHLVDMIFNKLNFYDINLNFFAKEILNKNHKIKKVKANFSKKENIDFAVSLNGKFLKKLTFKSKINKKKFSTFVMTVDNLDIQKVNDYTGYSKFNGLFNLFIEGNGNVQFQEKNDKISRKVPIIKPPAIAAPTLIHCLRSTDFNLLSNSLCTF